ncbi:MAG: hypothetical protein IIX44_11775 [Clostridia bacterium]|nr:hypothetical protein [Clostridia bacterium]
MRILFIGNSATYVHDIPETLARLASEAGFPTESVRVVKGGWRLSQHAEAGSRALTEIEKGYDLVVLQDNGNCIENDERRAASVAASEILCKAARESGAKVYFYVRPPYGYEAFGRSPVEQCREFDRFFTEIADRESAVCAYVNRAFEYAIENTDIRLWGDDNAHTSDEGAYLAVCVHFATIYGKSATLLGENGVREAKVLQEIADRIVLGG